MSKKNGSSGRTDDESVSIPSIFMDDESLSGEDVDVEDSGYYSSAAFSNSSASGDEDKDDSSGKLQFAKRETKAVLRLRLLVFDFLIVTSLAMSLIVYFWSTSAELAEYEAQYKVASGRVIDAFLDIANTKLASIAGVAVELEVHGQENGNQWPFVTLSRFQERTSTAMSQSGALYLHVNPLVTLDERKEWELYSAGEDSLWM